MRAATDPVIRARQALSSAVVAGTPRTCPVRRLEVQHARSN
ncbi:hypothetical protein [Aeromonas taiwanensis]